MTLPSIIEVTLTCTQGIAGRNEREDLKRKKEEKAARKRLQAEREVLDARLLI